MPPKVRITKEEIIQTAIQLVREGGESAVNARAIASALNCSTQPIFSNFATMEELKYAVIEEAELLCGDYVAAEIEQGKYPSYKSSGIAYSRCAKEEQELFKLLYMRDRSSEDTSQESDFNKQILNIAKDNTGLEEFNSKFFHLEMWAFVHGIATMFATGYLDLDWEIVSKMLTDAYQGLRKQYGLGV